MSARFIQGIDLVYPLFTRTFNRSLILLDRCSRNHVAFRQIENIMKNQSWSNAVEAKRAIQSILQLRFKYPELLRDKYYVPFFNSMLPLLNILNDAIDGEIDYRIPYGY